MIRHDVKQGTDAWLSLRLGIPTASEFGSLVTETFEPRTGKMPATYLATKLAEKWLGHPIASFGGGMLEQGSIREEEAIPWFESLHEIAVSRVGFITTDDGRAGCSPDGLFIDGDEEVGLEVKCPLPHTHIGYLLGGNVPREYAAQVQFSLFVTGLSRWRFLSYCRGLPPHIVTVERNEEAIEVMRNTLAAFNKRFDVAWARLVEMNGGEPVRGTEVFEEADEQILF